MSEAVLNYCDYAPASFYQSGGVSEESHTLAEMARSFHLYLSLSNTYGRLHEIQDAIDDAAADANHPNWDGDGAAPVVGHTISLARRFASALPMDIKLPEVYADSRGELTFEWRNGRGRIVSISVYANGTIGYLSLIGSAKSYGNESFVSSIPSELLLRIAKVYS